MKDTWRIALILSLALCLIFAMVACDNDDDIVYVAVTDSNGETMTDDEGNVVTAPDADGDGVADPTEEGKNSIERAGANTDGGYGPIIRPN